MTLPNLRVCFRHDENWAWTNAGIGLPFTSEPCDIAGVCLIRPQRLLDARGMFVEAYSKRDFTVLGINTEFVQDNEALSKRPGTMRGLHFQLSPDPQAKLVRVVAGEIFDAVVDLRSGSPTFGKWCGTTLSAGTGDMLFVPAGLAHGYCTLQPDTLVAYKADGYYNKEAERGIRWNDPEIGIVWPVSINEITVSEKDAHLPLLCDVSLPFDFCIDGMQTSGRLAGTGGC